VTCCVSQLKGEVLMFYAEHAWVAPERCAGCICFYTFRAPVLPSSNHRSDLPFPTILSIRCLSLQSSTIMFLNIVGILSNISMPPFGMTE